MERPGGCDQYLSCGDIFEVSFCNAVEGKEKNEVYDGSEDEAEDGHGLSLIHILCFRRQESASQTASLPTGAHQEFRIPPLLGNGYFLHHTIRNHLSFLLLQGKTQCIQHGGRLLGKGIYLSLIHI